MQKEKSQTMCLLRCHSNRVWIILPGLGQAEKDNVFLKAGFLFVAALSLPLILPLHVYHFVNYSRNTRTIHSFFFKRILTDLWTNSTLQLLENLCINVMSCTLLSWSRFEMNMKGIISPLYLCLLYEEKSFLSVSRVRFDLPHRVKTTTWVINTCITTLDK